MHFLKLEMVIFNTLKSNCKLNTENDECAENTHSCHVNATCTNTFGNYYCECNPGFSGSGNSCAGMLSLTQHDSSTILPN